MLYVKLVAGWVTEDDWAGDAPAPAHRLPAVAVLAASLLLMVLPPAVGLMLLLGWIA